MKPIFENCSTFVARREIAKKVINDLFDSKQYNGMICEDDLYFKFNSARWNALYDSIILFEALTDLILKNKIIKLDCHFYKNA